LGIGNSHKDEVRPQVVVLGGGREEWLPSKENRHVRQESAQDERHQLDGEVRERHLGHVGQNDLGGHSSKHNSDSDGKQDKVLILEDVRVRRRQPGVGADQEERDGQELRVGSQDRLVLFLARLVHGNQARGEVTENHQKSHASNHHIQQDPAIGNDTKVGAKDLNNLLAPDQGAGDSRDGHGQASNDQTLGRTIDVAKVKDAGVVLLPGRQEEGKGCQEQEKGSVPAVAHGHASSLVHSSDTTVQGIASVIKELSQGGRGSSPASLLSVHVVKSRVQP